MNLLTSLFQSLGGEILGQSINLEGDSEPVAPSSWLEKFFIVIKGTWLLEEF